MAHAHSGLLDIEKSNVTHDQYPLTSRLVRCDSRKILYSQPQSELRHAVCSPVSTSSLWRTPFQRQIYGIPHWAVERKQSDPTLSASERAHGIYPTKVGMGCSRSTLVVASRVRCSRRMLRNSSIFETSAPVPIFDFGPGAG